MRIAFIDYVLEPSKPGKTGLSDLVWDIAPRLVDMGDEVHVIGPYSSEMAPDRRVSVHEVKLPPIGYRNIVGHLWIILRAYQMLTQIKGIDLLHTPEYVSCAVVTALNKSIPFVFTEPGNIYERIENGNPYDPITTEVYKVAARTTARKADHLLASSEWMRDWWHRTGLPFSKITVIPLGIDTSLFKPVPRAKEFLGIAASKKVLLYAARLSRENGLDITLRAFSQLQKDPNGYELHILGEGPDRAKYEELARNLGIYDMTVWHGWVNFDYLPTYYSAADLFVFSGLSGGTPRVMLQAMACERPIVASRIGGITDHISEGHNGFMFDAGNEDEMAAQMLKVLENDELRARMGCNAAQYAQSHVDWDVLVPQIRAVYTSVLRGKSSEEWSSL